jgi:hypothetical protein
MLDWLDPLTDFLTVGTIVTIWAAALLLIWRVWRLEGIWGDREDHTPDGDGSGLLEAHEQNNQIPGQENPPTMDDGLSEQLLVPEVLPADNYSPHD